MKFFIAHRVLTSVFLGTWGFDNLARSFTPKIIPLSLRTKEWSLWELYHKLMTQVDGVQGWLPKKNSGVRTCVNKDLSPAWKGWNASPTNLTLLQTKQQSSGQFKQLESPWTEKTVSSVKLNFIFWSFNGFKWNSRRSGENYSHIADRYTKECTKASAIPWNGQPVRVSTCTTHPTTSRIVKQKPHLAMEPCSGRSLCFIVKSELINSTILALYDPNHIIKISNDALSQGESIVRTMKKLLKDSSDPYMSLLI